MHSEQPIRKPPILLLVAGILMVCTGSATVMLGFASLFPQFVDQAGPTALPKSTSGAAFAQLLMHVVAGVFVIVLGVGSIRVRRWVPPLAVSFGWIWLLAGLLMVTTTAAAAPGMLDELGPQITPHFTPAIKWTIFSLLLAVTVFAFIVIPVAMIAVYSRPRIVEACNALDPKPRWTDRCPPSVMPLPMSLALLAALLPCMAAYGALPTFHVILQGWPAVVVTLLLAVGLAWLAVDTARLTRRSWWLTLAALSVMTVSLVVTFLQIDLVTIYASMGISNADQLLSEQASRRLGWVMLLTVVTLQIVGTIYMIGVYRHFNRRPSEPQAEPDEKSAPDNAAPDADEAIIR